MAIPRQFRSLTPEMRNRLRTSGMVVDIPDFHLNLFGKRYAAVAHEGRLGFRLVEVAE